MSNQSTQFRLDVIIESQRQHGILTVTTLNGSIFLNFYKKDPTDKSNRIPRGVSPNYYKELSSFLYYRVKQKFSISFSDFNNSDFTIVFSTQQDMSDFIRFIKQRVQVISSSSEKYLYLMNPIDFGPSNAHTTFLLPKSPSLFNTQQIIDFVRNLDIENTDDEKPFPKQNEFTSLTEAFPGHESESKIDYLKMRSSWKNFYEYPELFKNQTRFFEISKNVDSNLTLIPELNEKHHDHPPAYPNQRHINKHPCQNLQDGEPAAHNQIDAH